MNEVKMFENGEIGICTRIIMNDDGSISVNAEDTAIGYGWTQTQTKNGKQYTSIRWETLNGYCAELGFPSLLGKDDYIPEPLFYRLGMKASNSKAEKFQNWLAFDVIPSIRKTGTYSIQPKLDSYVIEDPAKRARRWAEEYEEKKALEEKVAELTPKADLCYKLLDSRLLVNFRDAAKEIGISQTQFTGWLKSNGYVYSDAKGQLRPMEPYMKSGLFQMKPYQNQYNGYTGSRTLITGHGLAAFKLLIDASGHNRNTLEKHGGRKPKKR